jgi:voltage-gated potassium channel
MQARLEKPLLVAALLTIPALLFDQSSAEPWHGIAPFLNWLIWIAFAAEAVLMLRAVESPVLWLRTHPLEIAIIVLTPPFLPAGLQAARVFRLLRLLRLLRLTIIVRRLLSTEGVRDAAVFAGLTILGGGIAFSAIEKTHHGHAISAWDGVWWAVTTVTTVGYGDFYPVTTGGRILGIVVMLVGIGFVAILTAAAAARFARVTDTAESERLEMKATLAQISERLAAIERRLP